MSIKPKHFILKMFLSPSGFLTPRFGYHYAVLRQRFLGPSDGFRGASAWLTRSYGRRFRWLYAILRYWMTSRYAILRALFTWSYGYYVELR